jgi:hypothetical protein
VLTLKILDYFSEFEKTVFRDIGKTYNRKKIAEIKSPAALSSPAPSCVVYLTHISERRGRGQP